ncbi:MAG TPA: TetR/AcrR family transcriptional regulator [Bdellovibrionota bacterium]|jgi:TetR/AcrR family transcriptional repressor of nem operon|nr:TetR/AcrR family transcriptional regulator [Bdellovibrionota bacterium]
MPKTDTFERALVEGRHLLQRYGFNGFSFKHLAEALGIRTPSLYDHFASKEELGNRLIDSYREMLSKWHVKIETLEPPEKVREFFVIFGKFSRDGFKLCPASALTADWQTLPKSMRKNIQRLVSDQEAWLAGVIEEGIRRGDFAAGESARLATVVYAMGIGAPFLARVHGEVAVVEQIQNEALRFLRGSKT